MGSMSLVLATVILTVAPILAPRVPSRTSISFGTALVFEESRPESPGRQKYFSKNLREVT